MAEPGVHPAKYDTPAKRKPGILTSILFLPVSLAAQESGVAISTFESPNQQQESCISGVQFPGAVYDGKDRTTEQLFCQIDFYNGAHALCPKLFSTSPGTLVYDISSGPYTGSANRFESEQCTTSRPEKRGAIGSPVSYKMSINGRETSATFSTASLLYYHLSRYFETNIDVPVAVFRSMDREEHFARVTESGLVHSAARSNLAMNHAGWKELGHAEQQPSAYAQRQELFLHQNELVYGVMLQPAGRRYGAELNGTRKSGWGAGQNRDFQETAPFLALRSPEPIADAIEEGINRASNDSMLRDAMGTSMSKFQVAAWMRDIIEITLLDFIFSQQDRIGNVDYQEYWTWVDAGDLNRRLAASDDIPADIAAFHPLRIRRTVLNDNDAGGRIPYANYAKTTGMLEGLRHYNKSIYRKLMALDHDLSNSGTIYRHLESAYRLSNAQLAQIVKNTHQAAALVRRQCDDGSLRFDLDLALYLQHGNVDPEIFDCDS